ncbi:RNA recognition motif domain-containing protein [Candidatus Paracaedibacter symbiosus]|uniref:RNA recognition motif domain-containing protein n=1 Tax=Candidatus Paracaedibacter symbiosus TaxID=244582 RepID=UPI000509407F|nr:RNA-binding protein [Candidatus Paracaedibacter symbiosus]
MNKKLYVSNLPFGLTSESLNDLFQNYGAVLSAKIITDRDTGRSKGFGFVEMETEDQAHEAIDKLNGQEVQGRTITVAVAKPQTEQRAPRPARRFER